MLKMGFDYIAADDRLLDETREQLDGEGKGKVHIDKMHEYFSALLNDTLDSEKLRTAFK